MQGDFKGFERLILRRKAFFSMVFFSLGIITAGYILDESYIESQYIRIELILILIIFILIPVGLNLCKNIKKYKNLILKPLALASVLFLMGFLLMSASWIKVFILPFPNETFPNENKISGTIEMVEKGEYGYTVDISVNTHRVRVFIGNPVGIEQIGKPCEISLKEELELADPSTNPRCFDYRKYLLGKGISRVGYGRNLVITKDEANPIYRVKVLILNAREAFLDTVFKDENSKALAKGVLFGDSDDLDEDINKIFRENGTAHVLAVSGLHVGILYQVYEKISRLLSKKWEGIDPHLKPIFIAFLIIYGTSTLWSPSVLRAVSMVILKMLADSRKKRYDMLNSVSIINIGLLIYRPFYVYSMSFRLSFLAAYAIGIIVPRLKGKIPSFLALSLGVQMFLLPYMINSFNSFNTTSIFINIIIVYLISLYVPVGILAFVLYGLSLDPLSQILVPLLISPMGKILGSLGSLITTIGKELNLNRFFTVSFPSLNTGLTVFIMLTMAFLFSEILIVLNERKSKAEIGIVVGIIIIFSSLAGFMDRSSFDECSQVFIDVGQGDAIHLSWDDDTDILIDGGGRRNYNVGEKILFPYFMHNGINDLDLAITTHDHMDHYKGIQELNSIYPINDLIEFGVKGDIISFGDDRFIEILWPLKENINSADENYYSRVFMVNDRGLKTLITGDITEEGEKALMREYEGTDKLKCHILKVPHHGSRFSSSFNFIKEVNPIIAVISVGKRNSYGHPSPQVIEKFRDLGIIVYRTDLDGAVGVAPKENGFSVCTQKSGKRDNYS